MTTSHITYSASVSALLNYFYSLFMNFDYGLYVYTINLYKVGPSE
jgi:hypothetical protein